MKHLYHIVSVILVLFLVLFLNQKYYKEEQKENNLNTYLSVIVNGEEQSGFPSKESGFPSKESGLKVKEIICNNETEIYWDYESWGPVIKKLSKNNTKCSFTFASEYSEGILNGTDPVLKEGLIPVTISDDGTVKVAKLSEEWYDYETQRWANAVILEDESKKYYEGEIIPESNIESYFVWIPRYKYKIWNIGNHTELSSNVMNIVRTIAVIFENKDTPASNESTLGSYLTHPAFTSFNVNGLWVGKFETGYKGEITDRNIYDSDKVTIKPNLYSWRNIQVANAHLNSYNYKREYDSHMMKNTEWGAVAYLQHSIYGSRKSVRINNNGSRITGYGAKNEPTTGYTGTNIAENIVEATALNENGSNTFMYNTEYGKLASTTANITGIYDMSGGAYEYVMGVMKYSDNVTLCAGRVSTSSSGFKGRYCESDSAGSATTGVSWPSAKYYDAYQYATDNAHFNRRILGDATGEMGPFAKTTYGTQTNVIGSWYADMSYFVYNLRPFFIRGGKDMEGSNTGIFNFSMETGLASTAVSYRIVLAM